MKARVLIVASLAFPLLLNAQPATQNREPKPVAPQSLQPNDSRGQVRALPAFPQVWVDMKSGVFHSPRCKLIAPSFVRMSRTVAKRQRYQPAKECALTDAQASAGWNAELKRQTASNAPAAGVTILGTANRPVSADNVSTETADRSEFQQRSTPRAGNSVEPSWNEYMKATDYMGAEGVARGQCANEWPGDARMMNYCYEQQMIAVSQLRANSASLSNKAKRIACANEWPTDYRMRVYCESR